MTDSKINCFLSVPGFDSMVYIPSCLHTCVKISGPFGTFGSLKLIYIKLLQIKSSKIVCLKFISDIQHWTTWNAKFSVQGTEKSPEGLRASNVVKSSFLWPVYSAGVKNGPHTCIVEEVLNGRKKGSETIICFLGMEAAQHLAWLNKGTAVVDVVSLDFSRLKLFPWCPGIGGETIALVSAVIFF